MKGSNFETPISGAYSEKPYDSMVSGPERMTASQINHPQIGQADYQPVPPSIGYLLQRISDLEVELAKCRAEFSRFAHYFPAEDGCGCIPCRISADAQASIKRIDQLITTQPPK